MSKLYFTRKVGAVAIVAAVLATAACGGDESAKLYTTDDANNAGGNYKAMRCGEGLQTVDVSVGSTSNSQGLVASVKETFDTDGQTKVVVAASLPADKELPLVIVHAIDNYYSYGAASDKALQPSVAGGGKLDMQLATDLYAESPTSGGRITGVTLCPRSVAAKTS
jgi:hypothetical protein